MDKLCFIDIQIGPFSCNEGISMTIIQEKAAELGLSATHVITYLEAHLGVSQIINY